MVSAADSHSDDVHVRAVLKERLDSANFARLAALANPKLHAFVADAIELCQPADVFVCSDAPEEIALIRRLAMDMGEEAPLAIPGHTVHFDGCNDQGRDKNATRYLLPAGMDLGKRLASIERDEGLAEVRGYLAGSMAGRRMYVRFFCLGPTSSLFSISCVQLTDSAYVAHSEDLLYRSGYEQFKRLGGSPDFFRFLHSQGELDARGCSKNTHQRRVYIDIAQDMVYSANTQYGGNTIGFKKLALRLAIRRADREDWLAEHMFVMGVTGPEGRRTYFTGAFPSACGKTSTAMLPGETIVGDDIVYLRNIGGSARCVNVESGIFGIIQDVCAANDPVIWDVLHTPGEVIFSNVLVKDERPYWLGMGEAIPDEGVNFFGRWQRGMLDGEGKGIDPSHQNARYTVSLLRLANCDPLLDDPNGIPVAGFIYGGRDSDTSVPVQQSFDWTHGIITMGASLESETTAATIGQQGVRTFNLMSNLDFLSIPLGRYIENNLQFARGLKKVPLIFGVNYFLKDARGAYLNGLRDKAVWIKWMELRAHGEADAIATPTGLIPLYEDLARLFQERLRKEYTRAQYDEQFSLRLPANLAKLDRIEHIYRTQVPDAPAMLFETLAAQRERLLHVQAVFGDLILPERFQVASLSPSWSG